MEFKKLHAALDEINSDLEVSDFYIKNETINPRMEHLLNESEFFITIHDIEKLKPIFMNNQQKNYYGFSNNYFGNGDYFFYFLTLHPSSFSSLITSLFHFRNGGKDYLNLEYKLKKYNGKYETFLGTTKTIFENGKVKFAISVLDRKHKKADRNPEKIYAISQLTEREKQIALLYCDSKTVAEISEELNISINTTKTHLKSVYRKLEINNVKELIKEMKLIYP